jgi:two-component system, cell cycle response regulator
MKGLATMAELSSDQPALVSPPDAGDRALERLATVLPDDLQERAARTAHLADLVGRRLGLPAEALERLGWAARLHDIGRVVVPTALTARSGPLDEDEWRLVRWHPLVGARMILFAAPSEHELAALVRFSHERWDGFGYPDGLTGEAIPLGARIVCVCDAFAAMTSERAFREVRSPAAALGQLRRGAGRQFDPGVVQVLGEVIEWR